MEKKKYNVCLVPKDGNQVVSAESEKEAEEIAIKNYVLEFESVEVSEIEKCDLCEDEAVRTIRVDDEVKRVCENCADKFLP